MEYDKDIQRWCGAIWCYREKCMYLYVSPKMSIIYIYIYIVVYSFDVSLYKLYSLKYICFRSYIIYIQEKIPPPPLAVTCSSCHHHHHHHFASLSPLVAHRVCTSFWPLISAIIQRGLTCVPATGFQPKSASQHRHHLFFFFSKSSQSPLYTNIITTVHHFQPCSPCVCVCVCVLLLLFNFIISIINININIVVVDIELSLWSLSVWESSFYIYIYTHTHIYIYIFIYKLHSHT